MRKGFVFVLILCALFGGASGYWFWFFQKPALLASKPQSQAFPSPVSPPPSVRAEMTKNPPFSHSTRNAAPVLPMAPGRSKPKLAIVMDDMAYPWQLKALHELKLKITPSFFPRGPDTPHTPAMASAEPFYMVHLPMEALHFYQSSHPVLKTGESREEMEVYVGNLKKDFPRLKYVNNHTGSKFTASRQDMLNFISVLEEFGITFVDSRTTADTKAPEIYAQMHKPLLFRQVFLDNDLSVKAILVQIKKAVKIAEKNGWAIAIAHPHKETFKALKVAKKKLFDHVELTYVKDLDVSLRGKIAK